jgi:hypothetical protein
MFSALKSMEGRRYGRHGGRRGIFVGEMKITLFARKSRKRGGRERMI